MEQGGDGGGYPRVLAERRVLMVVCGGIAAYKAAEMLRLLQKHGADVRVVMTRAAQRFVGPLTFQALSSHPVSTDLFDLGEESRIGHVALARDTDLVLVIPATANCLAKAAHGLADDLASTVLLATRARVVFAPAMNTAMWEHPATQENVATLQARPGVTVIRPDSGYLACKETGAGKLPPLEDILEEVLVAMSPKDLAGARLLVTAGPTREPIDPVRFVSNHSTGKMGFAVAKVARRRGAEVTLVTGPVSLPDPVGVDVVRVQTALQLHDTLMDLAHHADVLVMTAAVADVRPREPSTAKMPKSRLQGASLHLDPNPDILARLGELGVPRIRVGFAAQTGPGLDEARRKLRAKGCQLLAYNRVDLDGQGFGADTNRLVLLDQAGREEEIPLAHKEEVAGRLLDRVASLLAAEGREHV